MTTSEWPLMFDGEPTSILSAAPTTPRTRVLVAERDSWIRRSIVQTLTEQYLTSAAADAAQALHLLDLERYDVVVLAEDLVGSVARTIRAWPSRWDIGLIALTADATAGAAVGLLEAGCDALLSRQLVTSELAELVREVARARSRGVGAKRGKGTLAA